MVGERRCCIRSFCCTRPPHWWALAASGSRGPTPLGPICPPEDARAGASEPGAGRPTRTAATGQPVTGQPVTGQPATGQPVTGQPVTGQTVTGQPATGQAVTGQAVTGQDAETEELLRYFERPARLWLALVAVPFLGLGALAADPSLGGLDQAWALGAVLVWLAATLIAGSLVRAGAAPDAFHALSAAQPGTADQARGGAGPLRPGGHAGRSGRRVL